jgi:universal stress protein E
MPNSQIRKILVAVENPVTRSNKAVRRAAQMARQTGASLELFSAVRVPAFSIGGMRFEATEVVRTAVEQNLAALKRLAKPLLREEIIVETTASIVEVVHEAILRRAQQCGADLIIIEARMHAPLARVLLRQVDFELIRRSTLPLLIVKDSKPWKAPRVLAALDPFHSHDKPRNLDAKIAGAAKDIADAVGGVVHAGYIFCPLAEYFPNVVMEPAVMALTPNEERNYEANVKREFRRAAESYGIAARYCHLRRGDPGIELPLLARSLKTRLVAMGAVSRSGFGHSFIGNTAERILDRLPCDVLIVKPDATPASQSN